MIINNAICKNCGMCYVACQMKAIRMKNAHWYIDNDRCTQCGLCTLECKNNAIEDD